MFRRCEVFARQAFCQNGGAFFGAERASVFAHKVERAFQLVSVDHDADDVAVAELANGTARECLGSDMPDARAGAHTAEARVSDERDFLAEWQMLQRGR